MKGEKVMKIALQLWSIKEEAEQNFEKALELTAKVGYGGVEFAGYFGYSAVEMKALLAKYGLTPVSTHTGIDNFTGKFDTELEYALNVGYRLIVCPWLDCKSIEEITEAASVLEACAQKALQKGIVVGYHNHNQEFQKFGGKYAMDILLEKAPSVKYEPDLFWIAYAGLDPVSYIKPYLATDRVCAIHVKEIAAKGTANVYVGEGRIDFAAVAKLADPEKIPYIVEQEEYTSDHLDGITKSFTGIKRVLEGIRG
jgi:sugar phosphate isomerase/epimerase